MKKQAFLIICLFLITGMRAQISPCPGLKNPASFTSGSTFGEYVGFYSGQTGEKRGSIAPNAETATTGINLISDIIPASQLANITGNGGTSYCSNTLDPTKRFRIMSNTEGPVKSIWVTAHGQATTATAMSPATAVLWKLPPLAAPQAPPTYLTPSALPRVSATMFGTRATSTAP